MNIDVPKYLITQTLAEWKDDNASRLAAALAYYTIFSIPPLLIIAIAIAAQIFDREIVQQQIIGQISELVGKTGATAIESILDNAGEPSDTIIATVISVVTLLLGASGVFGQLQDSLNVIWEVAPKQNQTFWNTIQDRFFSFTMVLGVGFLLLVSLIVSTSLAAFDEFVMNTLPTLVILAQLINFVVSFGIITILFALIFKVIPDVQVAWRDVWVGAGVTALLFTIGKWAIGLYLGNSAPGSTYGAAGSLIVLLLWIYYSAQILFFGAEFTQVYANKYGSHIIADGDILTVPEALETSRQQQEAESNNLAQPEGLSFTVGQRGLNRPVQAELPKHLESIENKIHSFHSHMVQALAVVVAGWQFVTKDLPAMAKR